LLCKSKFQASALQTRTSWGYKRGRVGEKLEPQAKYLMVLIFHQPLVTSEHLWQDASESQGSTYRLENRFIKKGDKNHPCFTISGL
jgi:hypothetical protein